MLLEHVPLLQKGHGLATNPYELETSIWSTKLTVTALLHQSGSDGFTDTSATSRDDSKLPSEIGHVFDLVSIGEETSGGDHLAQSAVAESRLVESTGDEDGSATLCDGEPEHQLTVEYG